MAGIINRSYYAASEQGRQDAQSAQVNALRAQAMRNDLEQENVLRGLMQNPQATPEQFARAGRSDIANSLQNLQPDRAAQAKEWATQMTNAARYAAQAPAGQTKQFIERNFPFLVETYGPEWATASDEQVRQELTGIGARFAVQAGIGPEKQPGESGAMYRYVDSNGNPAFGNASDVRGKRPYEAQPQEQKAPVGYRFVAGGGVEPIPGGPADPAAGKGKITDTERQTAAYATRMRKAADTIAALNYVPTTADMVLFNRMLSGPGMMQSAANKLLSKEAQQYLQAVQDFNRAKLRKESGAAIGKEEVFGDLSTFFPVPGDDATTLEQKAKARETAIEGMIGAAGPAYKAPAASAGGGNAPKQAPPAALEYLKVHPEAKAAFKAKYGYLP